MARRKKKTSPEELMLVPVDPLRRRRLRVYGALALVLALLAAYVGGEIRGRQGEISAERERDELLLQVRELEEQLQSARDDLALQRTSTEMAEQAQSQVRQEIRSLRDQVAELEEAVSFYKNVMAPGSREEGLHIEKLDLEPAAEPGLYRYKLVLIQLGDNRAYLSGQVQMQMAASSEEEAVTIDHGSLLADDSETRFRFRYFQELSGHLRLPEGVAPERVTVEAVATGRRRDRAEKEFNLRLQESNGARPGQENSSGTR